jgi:mannosyltransferase
MKCCKDINSAVCRIIYFPIECLRISDISVVVSDRTVIIGLTLLALVLRAWGADSDLWLDEIITLVSDMRDPLIDVITHYRSANQHVLNSVLGNISVYLLGESSWTARLPAMLFGVATIPAFFVLARNVTTRREAFFSGLFLAVSYHHIWFSQNARGYSAMIFFTVVSTNLLLRQLQGRHLSRALDWGFFALISALGMLSLLNYAFVVVGQFLAVAIVCAKARQLSAIPRLFLPATMVVALTLLGYSMMLSEMVTYYVGGGEEMGWQDPSLFAVAFVRGLTGSLSAMAILAVLIGTAIAITGGLSYLKEQALIPIVPVVAIATNLVALAVLNFGAYPRSFLYLLPFAVLILMRGAFLIGGLPRHYLATRSYPTRLEYVIPALVVAGAIAMLPHLYRYPKQDYSGALAYARLQAAPDDTIAVVGYLAFGYQAYHAPGLAFPANVAGLDALRASDKQVWVLYSFTRDMHRHFADINDYIDEEFRVYQVFPGTLGDGDIYLVTARGEKNPAPTTGSISVGQDF